MAEGTNLAERGKEKISAAQAIEMAKQFVSRRHKEQSAERSRALAEAERFAGGTVDRLDKSAVDQGRAWATRLALISRATAGSGYQTNKASQKVAAVATKVFAIVGELEAIVATDVEISLFGAAPEDDRGYGRKQLAKLKVGDFTQYAESGDEFGQDEILDRITSDLPEQLERELQELFAQYEIEPIVIPGETEGEQPSNNGGRRRKRS